MDEEKIPSINVKNLRDQLSRLTKVKDVPIKQLSEAFLDDFTAVSHNISSLYGTDGYNLLFKEIQDKFPMQTKAVPGTVNGYFTGCFVPSNFKYGNTCSLSCLTGTPAFHDSIDSIPCNRNVYIAPFETGYTFTQLAQATEDLTSAIIFIQPPFKGFTKDEVKQLKSNGLQSVVLSYYDEQKGEYFTSDPLSFSQIQARSGPIKASGVIKGFKVKTMTSSMVNNIMTGVIVILLLMLSGYALWTMRNN
jgi:hypothetical protein